MLVVERGQLGGEGLRHHPAVALLRLGAEQHLGRRPAAPRGAAGRARSPRRARPRRPARSWRTPTPPAPRSLNPAGTPRSRIRRNASAFATCSTRFRNGSGSCTAPRWSPPSSPEANAAPPKPLSSVGFPTSTNAHGPVALRHAAAQDAVARREPHGHHVHQAVGVEAAVEHHVAAQVRHAERVAVVGDALHHAAHHVARVHARRAGRRSAARPARRPPRRPCSPRRARSRRSRSRRPRPAAPGSGWLWLSCASTSARSSQGAGSATTPASSPGPRMTCGARVGSRRSRCRVDL